MSRFKEWWQANPERAEEIRAARRLRRRADPEPLRAAARAAYARQSEDKLPGKGRDHNKAKFLWVNGAAVELWGLGQTIKFLGISRSSLQLWEEEGVIPTNRLVDDLKRHWWPAAFVQWLQPFVAMRLTRQYSKSQLKARVEECWNEDQQNIPQVGHGQDDRGSDHYPRRADREG